MAYGHPIETVIGFLSFLYYCLRLERYETIACFDDEYMETLIPPVKRAVIDPTTAMCDNNGSNLLIMTVGVKQLTRITIQCSLSVISQVFLAQRMPALQINSSILSFFWIRYLMISSTDSLLLRSTFLHQQLPPNSVIYLLTSSKRSLRRSRMRILQWYSLVSSRAISLPIPMHAPAISTKLFLSSRTGSFLPRRRLTICAKMIAKTTQATTLENPSKMLAKLIIIINYINDLQICFPLALPWPSSRSTCSSLLT